MARMIFGVLVAGAMTLIYVVLVLLLVGDVSDTLKGVGAAVFVLSYHYAGVEFALIEQSAMLEAKDKDEPPAPPTAFA